MEIDVCTNECDCESIQIEGSVRGQNLLCPVLITSVSSLLFKMDMRMSIAARIVSDANINLPVALQGVLCRTGLRPCTTAGLLL